MSAKKELNPSDGDALFVNACLSCVRGSKPRDGGLAIGVLSDWLQERFDNGAKWVALGDPDVSGFVFTAMLIQPPRGENGEDKYGWKLHSPAGWRLEMKGSDVEDFGEAFRETLAEQLVEAWSVARDS